MSRIYSYKALDNKTGKTIFSRVEAANEVMVEQMLNDSNLTLIYAKEIKTAFLSSLGFRRIKTKDLITTFVALEQLERAGVHLLDSLKDLKDNTENPRLKSIMQSIYESVKNGEMLSTAMGRFPKVFSEVNVSLVAMGERTGNLDLAFKNIYENLKWNAELKRKTIKAVRGPIVSLLLLVGVGISLLKLVVPKVLAFIIDLEIEVPIYTKALLATSEFLEQHFLKMVVVLILFVMVINILLTNGSFKIKFDQFKLKLPILGPVMKKIDLSRFTKFFGVTFSVGIPVLQCIEIANNVVANHFIRTEISYAKQKIADGKTITKSLEETNIFPYIVLRMFKIGEDSGNMDDAMKNVQYFYESEINDAIDMVIGSLQPIILAITGALMLWIIAAVFGPIYGNFSNMV